MSEGREKVVYAALGVNVAIALAKLVAALLSRSSAMLAEACHSFADTANQVFLLIGLRRGSRDPDAQHPFGYGMETYFWSFIVALCIFAIGGGVSVLEGIEKIAHRDDPSQAMHDPRVALVVLGISIVLESYSFYVAMGELREIRAGRSLRRTLKDTRDPTVLTVLFEDLAALFGLVVAVAGIVLSWRTGAQIWDGLASVIVGVALVAVAGVLAHDAKALLIGKSASATDEAAIGEVVKTHPDVEGLVHMRTMHLGPSEILLALKVRFSGQLTVATLETRINELEARLRDKVPSLRRIYIEPGFDERPGRVHA